MQRQLSEPPTKLVTSAVVEGGISFPQDDEATLDKHIKSRQAPDAPEGKRIGTVTYKNLPAPAREEKATKEANLERWVAKHALLEVITPDIGGTEMRLRVPLDDDPTTSKYAMIVLRFDKQRNVEVEYADGSKNSNSGSVTASARQADLRVLNKPGTQPRKFTARVVTDFKFPDANFATQTEEFVLIKMNGFESTGPATSPNALMALP